VFQFGGQMHAMPGGTLQLNGQAFARIGCRIAMKVLTVSGEPIANLYQLAAKNLGTRVHD
jgi:hypothetical protein